MAGKYHRYSGWKVSDYFKYWDVTLKDLIWGNIKGVCGFVGGLIQSFVRLVRRSGRPDVIFLKGGFVGLPVGLVARMLKIPYVVHESDAVPGLANRVLMKRATVVAHGLAFARTEVSHVDMPRFACVAQETNEDVRTNANAQIAKQSSRDSLARTCRYRSRGARSLPVGREWSQGDCSAIWVGIPVSPEYKPVSPSRQKQLKKAYGFDPEKPLVVVTGGSQGAANINVAMREILPEMLKSTSVGLVVGRKHYEDMVDLKKRYEDWDKARLMSNFRMWEFCTTMNELMGAADVVVSRAGATTIAELAALRKAVILVPYERLPGSHQVKNADKLAKLGAVEVLYDARMLNQPGLLLEKVRHLVRSPKKRELLAEKLHEQAKPEAARELAEILLGVAGKK